MKKSPLFLFLFLSVAVFAQKKDSVQLKRTVFEAPKEIAGFKVRYATLSKGRYQEFFSNDTIQQIGSVLFNRVTGEVVGEVVKDSLYFPADVVSRWWSVDPLAEKYPELSPYVFVANNPIKYIDPDGRDIVLTITDETAWNLYERVVNEGLQGQFQITRTKLSDGSYDLGITCINGKGDISKMTDEGKAFYNYMTEAIGDRSTKVSMTLVLNSDDVNVGHYGKSQLDMGDIIQFNQGGSDIDYSKPTGATQQGKLIHETVEQYEKAKMDIPYGSQAGYNVAHPPAIQAENAVNGNERQEKGRLGRGVTFQYFKEKNGTMTEVRYTLGSSFGFFSEPMKVTQTKSTKLPKNK
ncbi:MAG: hypothetical protein MUE81_10255 [Thermoflexibacter sp.]|jgi:hypothetical protein|nr:hypothetical protein [Thermoflexibacter sp.]